MERTFDEKPVAAVSSTSILDLNEDCLLESFEYLEPWELACVADVCTRFREIAQTHFQSSNSKHKRLNTSIIYREKGMRGVSKVLRNFGAYIVSISTDMKSTLREKYPEVDLTSLYYKVKSVEKKVTKLACRYCDADTLQEFNCSMPKLEDDLDDRLLLRLILQLKRFHLDLTKRFNDYGPSLNFSSETNTPLELEELTLKAFHLDFTMVDQLLQRNAHLKKIGIYYIKLNNGDVIQAIAKYHPLIEQIGLEVSHEADVKYLGNLSKLKSVEFGSTLSNILIALKVMAKAPLEHLRLIRRLDCVPSWEGDINQLLKSIAKFENLKTLALFHIGLEPSQPIEICTNLAELNHFELGFWDGLTVERLLEMVRNAQALQYFYCGRRLGDIEAFSIDCNTFSKLVNLVKDRPKKSHLEIVFNQFPTRTTRELGPTTVLDVPDDLVRANTDSLTITTISKDVKPGLSIGVH